MSEAEVITYESVEENCQDFLGSVAILKNSSSDDVRWKRFVTERFFAFGLISQRGVIGYLRY